MHLWYETGHRVANEDLISVIEKSNSALRQGEFTRLPGKLIA